MALRDQPYLPLYIQDFLTDEKLNECSAAATGIYIKIMCLMHKGDPYGKILLKQKDKQTGNQKKDFALKVAKLLPFDNAVVLAAVDELLNEDVIQIEGDYLVQKRMVKDGKLSLTRSNSGSKGGLSTQNNKAKFEAKPTAKSEAKPTAKSEANSEYEIETENEY